MKNKDIDKIDLFFPARAVEPKNKQMENKTYAQITAPRWCVIKGIKEKQIGASGCKWCLE